MTRQLSDPLTDDDKEWLRSWNRSDEIPGEADELDEDGPADLSDVEVIDETEADADEQGDDPEDGEDDGADDVPYSELTVGELKDLLRDRGLPVGGKHGDLVERLEADDASK